jgi:eukaryotic-like serine/threonine-protein kinase
MTPERFQQIDRIFQQVLDQPPDERSSFLQNACADDPDLHKEVQELLAHESGHNGLSLSIRISGVANDIVETQAPNLEGRRIGAYKVVRRIGRGGMGAVYLALRDDDFQQQVAIKVVRGGGMDSEELLRRLRYERQLLAFLAHPNVARLLDGGATEAGEPYLVMEYVEGVPITEYCRKHNLTIDERIDLFLAVCAGVQHAHTSLIVHRDLKPGNILVTAEGIPKLLDFGIAKLVLPDTDGVYLPATDGVRVFTPDYASPEQVRGQRITAATDIYSLGVILFEMLAGRNPYRLKDRTAGEVERAICETEVQKPSTVARAAAENAATPPWRQLLGDLDNIVLKAMRKEPEHRYRSVEELAEDLRRHKEGLPVRAHRGSLHYRMRKFVRRHGLAIAAATVVILSLSLGAGVALQQARRAERRFQEVRKLANTFIFDIDDQIQNLPGSTAVREAVVTTGLRYLDGLAADAQGDPTLQLELAAAYQRIGDVQGDPLGPNLGQFRQALASYQQALTLLETASKKARDFDVLQRIVWLHLKCGELQARTQSVDTAMKSYLAALEIAKGIAARENRGKELLAQSYLRIALAQEQLGDNRTALENARAAADAADHFALVLPDSNAKQLLAITRTRLGDILWIVGDLDGALVAYTNAMRWQEELLAQQPDRPERMEQLQIAYRKTADLLGNPSFFYIGDAEHAEVYHRKALDLAERLAARDERNARAKALLYEELRRLGAVMRDTKPEESAAVYERSLQGLEVLWKDAPEDLGYRRDLANTRLGYAITLGKLQRYKPALAELDLAIPYYREILKQDPNRQVIQQDLFDGLLALGKIQMASSDYEAARQSLQESLSLAQTLSRMSNAGLYEERCLALAEAAMGDLEATLRHRSEANTHYANALAIWSGWKNKNLARAYASLQEQSVLRARNVRVSDLK